MRHLACDTVMSCRTTFFCEDYEYEWKRKTLKYAEVDDTKILLLI